MCECNGVKLSAKLFCMQEFSKEAGITHLVAVVELGDKKLGVQEHMKATYAHLEGSSEETGHSIILRLVIGSSADTYAVKVDAFIGRGVQDPGCRG